MMKANSVTLSDVLSSKQSRKLIDVKYNESVFEVLRIMRENDILALPVYEDINDIQTEEGPWSLRTATKSFVGIINMLDISIWVVNAILRLNVEDIQSSLEELLKSTSVGHIVGGSTESQRIHVAIPGSPLKDSMRTLASGLHRVMVPLKVNGEVEYQMFSQIDVVKYLYSNLDVDEDWKRKANLSLTVLQIADPTKKNIFDTNVVVVASSWSVFETISFMAANELYAVGVVDENCKLIGNLSLSDLRSIDKMVIMLQNRPVSEFLFALHGVDTLQALPTPIKCHYNDILRDVMGKIVECPKYVHRVWVVDSEQVPIEIVSLTDIIAVLI
ncbi:hypothetical protein HK098_002326 [Nowakowskiella sp. JEL0407]|nr:hypothetical protein HK098_002326 [Nowakowskiella sp. JEL0407]